MTSTTSGFSNDKKRRRSHDWTHAFTLRLRWYSVWAPESSRGGAADSPVAQKLLPRTCHTSVMTKPTYDHDFWEQLWSKTLREPRRQGRAPSAKRASDGRGCRPTCWARARRWLWTWRRHALARRAWLAGHGGGFLCGALARGRSMAEAAGADVAERIDWIEGDLATWTVESGHYDLVACLYVHVVGSVEEMVRRMASGVAPGGNVAPRRTPPDRSQHRSCHGRRRSGASLGRGCGRCARSQGVGAGRRGRAAARRRRYWCRCGDPRAASELSRRGEARRALLEMVIGAGRSRIIAVGRTKMANGAGRN